MSFLGLDVGTTGCKALAVDEAGRIIAQAYRDYPLICPRPGWNELDSGGLWKSIKQVISEVSRRVGADSIRAIGVSSQGETIAPVGKDGIPVGNFMVTFDNRAEPQTLWWEKNFGKKALFHITGMPLHPMYGINKILWMKENSPEVYSRTWKFLCVEDFVIFKLCGRAVIDYSLAARTMCLEIRRKEWSEKVLTAAGVEEGLLAEPRPSGYAAGSVRKEMAEELGLKDGAVVATGGHDQPCGALGAGAVRPGMMMNAIGTSDVLCPTLEKAVLTEGMLTNNYCCYPHVVPDAYITITFNLTGGLLLRWYRDTLCAEEVREARTLGADPYDVIVARASENPAGVYVLPHFVGSGTPTLDSGSRGAIVGLTLGTTKGELSRAMLDSNNYDLRLNMDRLQELGVRAEEIRAIGGGAKSPRWLQMRADVLGKPIAVPGIPEAAALGAAILAAMSVRHFASVQAAVDAWVKVARTYEPDMKMHDLYEEKYRNYLKLYPALKNAKLTF